MERRKFKCEACEEVFKPGWSEEKAKEEFEEKFPGEELDETCSVVCDDCYKKLMGN